MKRVRLLLSVVILLGVLGGGFAWWLERELHTPVAHPRSDQYVDIPRGFSTAEVTERLAAIGVIRRAWPLLLYIRLNRLGPRLKAGQYRFPSPISPLGVLRKLEEGEQRLSRFTIIEGWTRWDIASAMAHIPELKLSSADEALALMDDTSSIRDLDPQAKNLEGYLYPDTYNFAPNTSAREVVATLVRRFRQVWINDFAERARESNISLHEALTVASLVESEAKLKEERPLIASVIYNRLRRGMPLGIDSTVIYAAKVAGKWKNDGRIYQSDLDRDSPYNTRKVRGLPPGPVGSPSARSLEAALSPAETDYLYYVRNPARDDGAHNFYHEPAEFERGVQALREWERQQREREAAPDSTIPESSPEAGK